MFISGDLLDVDSIHFFSGLNKVELEVIEEVQDVLDGFTRSEVLAHFDENFSDMAPFGGDRKLFDDFFKILLGFSDLNERGTSVHETVKEIHALVDSIHGEIVLFAVSLVGRLSDLSLVGGSGHLSFSSSDQSFISSDEGFESSSLWVEGVLEMSRSNTKSDFSVSKSLVDFLVEFVMLSGSPSLLFFLRTEFEVKVSDEVLESGDQFIHWALCFDL
jgi:hypothetical protein